MEERGVKGGTIRFHGQRHIVTCAVLGRVARLSDMARYGRARIEETARHQHVRLFRKPQEEGFTSLFSIVDGIGVKGCTKVC